MRFASTALLLLSALLVPGIANAAGGRDSTLQAWFDQHKISLRRTFDGSKNEAKPAALTFTDDRAESSPISSADVALKVAEWSPGWFENLTFYPTGEWHRREPAKKPQHVLSAAANVELLTWPVLGYDKHGKVIPGTGGIVLAPFVVAASEWQRDRIARTSTFTERIAISAKSNKPWLPGSQFRGANHAYLGLYYPYVGMDIIKPSTGSQTTTLGMTRVYLEYLPGALFDRRFVQLLGDWSYRRHFSGPIGAEHHLQDLQIAANFFLNASGNAAIGVAYARGEDAKNAYQFRERSWVEINVKF